MTIEMVETFVPGSLVARAGKSTAGSEVKTSHSIKVIGVGGGGGNAVRHMIKTGNHVSSEEWSVEFICANTDKYALGDVVKDCQEAGKTPPTTIQLGSGLGAGGDPAVGRKAAEDSLDAIKAVIGDAKLVFITAGMGKGTGTGASPVVAKVAKDAGALVVGVVTKPRILEGKRNTRVANDGITELESNVDSLIVLLNDNIRRVFEDEGKDFNKVLGIDGDAAVDDVLKNAVEGLCKMIVETGRKNVDFSDVAAALRNSGRALTGIARASGENRMTVALQKAFCSPMLEAVDLSKAKSILILLRFKKDNFYARELDELREFVLDKFEQDDDDLRINIGENWDEELGEELQIMTVVTGLQKMEASHHTHGTAGLTANMGIPDIQSGIQIVEQTGTDGMSGAPVIRAASTFFDKDSVLQNAQAPLVPSAITPSVAYAHSSVEATRSVHGNAAYATNIAAVSAAAVQSQQQERYPQQHYDPVSSTNGLLTTRGDRLQQQQRALQQQQLSSSATVNTGAARRPNPNKVVEDLGIPVLQSARHNKQAN